MASWAELGLHQLRARKGGTIAQTGIRQGCGRQRLSGTRSEKVVSGPPLSRVVVGQGCLARFTCPCAEACCPMGHRQSTSFESLRRPRANLRGVDCPIEFSRPRRRNRIGQSGRGCRDAQGHGRLRMFVAAIRHPAMQAQDRHGAGGNLQKVRMTKHLTAAFRASAQGPACSPAWQTGTQIPKQHQHDGNSQKATTAPACGSGMISPWVLRLLWIMLWCYYVCSDDGRAWWLRR